MFSNFYSSIFMTRSNLVFIDSSVENSDVLLSLLTSHSQVFMLSPDMDGVVQIQQAVATYQQGNYRKAPQELSIHIISHGAPGLMYLGASELSLNTLPTYADTLHEWFSGNNRFSGSKQAQANALVLYGCNVAVGDAGSEFIERLHQLTGATIRASNTSVGHRSKGGNWNLSVQVGSGDVPLAFRPNVATEYAGVLNGDRFYRYIEKDLNLTFTSIKNTGDRIFKATDQGAPIDAAKFNANDDGEVGLSLPFNFNYYGNVYSDITIGVNGGVILGTVAGSVSPNNASLPDEQPSPSGGTSITPAIFPYWDDLTLEAGGSGDVYYESFTDTFVVEWNNVAHEDAGDAITFQLILYKDSNEIAFVYDDVSFNAADYDFGKDATIGLSGGENNDDGVQYSQDTPALNGITALRFLSDPRLENNAITIGEAETITLTSDQLLFNDFDSPASDITYTISNVEAASFALDGNLLTGATVTFTQADINGGKVQLIHDGSETPSSFDMVVNDQYADPTPASIAAEITFELLNDAPIFTGLVTALPLEENALNASSNGSAVVIDDDVSLTDTDSVDFNGGQIHASYSNGGGTEDQLGIRTAGLVEFDGALVSYDTVVVGNVSQTTNGVDGKDLIIALNSSATAEIVGAVLETLTYQNSSETPTDNRTVSIVITDGDNGISDTLTTLISVTAENDAPILHTPLARQVEEDKTLEFIEDGVISISDVDAEASTVQVTLAVTNGVLDVDGQSDSTITLSNTVTHINAALAEMTFTPNLHFNGIARFDLMVSDQGNSGSGGPLTDDKTFQIEVVPANDAPVNTVPVAQTVAEEAILTLSGADKLAIADLDAKNADVEVTLSVNHGTLSLPSSNGLQFIQGSGADDRVLKVQGTIAVINTAMDGLTYRGNQDFVGTDTLTIITDDLGNTGIGGGLIDTDTVDITVTGVNDAPEIQLPPAPSTVEEQPLLFADTAAILISDIDAGAGIVEVTLTVTNGTVEIADQSDSTLTLTDTVANLNVALSTMTYVPAQDFRGTAALEVTISDLGNNGVGGALTDNQTLNINVGEANDAPVNNVPTAQSIDEETPLVFSTATQNPISITDQEAGTADVQAILSVNHGTLTLNNTSGLQFIQGSGTDDATVQVQGTLAAINAALEGLAYRGNKDYMGADTLIITTDDLGNSGVGGALRDTDTVDITVNGINDAPVIQLPLTQSTGEEEPLTFTGNAQILISDVDAATGAVQVTLTATNGTLTVNDQTNSVIVLTDTVAAINTMLTTMTFNPEVNFIGVATLKVDISDQGNSGVGGPLMDSQTLSISVNETNDAPVNTVPNSQTVDEDKLLTFAGLNQITIDDSDAGLENVDVLLSVNNGTLTLDNTAGLQITQGTGIDDSIVQVVGSLTAINAALDGLSYQSNQDFNGLDQLTITTDDLGNTGIGSPLRDTDTVDITVFAVNDAPVNTVPSAQTIDEDLKLAFTDANQIVISDVDAADGDSMVQVTLAVTQGTLSLEATLSSLDFLNGDGTQDVTMVFKGLLPDVNAALVGLVYQGDANISGADTLTVTTNDQGNAGSGGTRSTTETVDITILPINDAPIIAGFNDVVEFTEEALNQTSSVVLDDSVTLIDTDSDNFDGGFLRASYPFGAVVDDQLAFQDVGNGSGEIGINGSIVSYEGTEIGTIVSDGRFGNQLDVELNENATLAAVQALLETLTYQNTSDDPISTRTVEIVLDDGDGNTSVPISTLIVLDAFNDKPVIVTNQLAIAEEQTITLSNNHLKATDEDNNDATLTFEVVSVEYGDFLVDGLEQTSFTQQTLMDGRVEFRHYGGELAPAYEIRVRDEGAPTEASTAAIDFTNINDDPVLIDVVGTITLDTLQVETPNIIDSAVTLTDVDSANFDGGNVTISYVSGGGAIEDQLAIINQGTGSGQIAVNQGQIFYEGVDIGFFDDVQTGVNGAGLKVNFNSNATLASAQALTQAIAYYNSVEIPNSDRTIAIQLQDGDGGTTLASNVIISITREIQGSGTADAIQGKANDDIIFGLSDNDKISGSDGDDILYGGDGRDRLKGGNGNDVLYGSGDKDKLDGGDGNDKLYGGSGVDVLKGGKGNDIIHGEEDNDKLIGSDGRDKLYGDRGNDRLNGGKGNDELYGDDGKDKLIGLSGNDALFGGKGNDRLKGGQGDDSLIGFKGNDTLNGGNNNDRLDGGRGRNQLIGGKGEDVFVLDHKGYAIIKDFSPNIDKIELTNNKDQSLFGQLDITQKGNDTILQLGNKAIAKLMNVTIDQIPKTDFEG